LSTTDRAQAARAATAAVVEMVSPIQDRAPTNRACAVTEKVVVLMSTRMHGRAQQHSFSRRRTITLIIVVWGVVFIWVLVLVLSHLGCSFVLGRSSLLLERESQVFLVDLECFTNVTDLFGPLDKILHLMMVVVG
jgi:hypothetical protein